MSGGGGVTPCADDGDDVLSNSWFCLVNWHMGEFGPRPGGISIYVGAKGRYWTHLSHRKFKVSI